MFTFHYFRRFGYLSWISDITLIPSVSLTLGVYMSTFTLLKIPQSWAIQFHQLISESGYFYTLQEPQGIVTLYINLSFLQLNWPILSLVLRIGTDCRSGTIRISQDHSPLGSFRISELLRSSDSCDLIWWCIFVHQYLLRYVFTVGQYICRP